MFDDQRRAQFSHTTVFFRNRPQLEELVGVLLPRLLPAADAEPLDVLICGGSTGCEAFSLQIALREFAPPGRPPLAARVLSVEIEDAVTLQARAALYPAENFQPLFEIEGGMPPEVRARWFTAEADGAAWRPAAELRAMTEFVTVDLAEVDLGRTFDLIVCQHVLTHYHPPGARALLRRLLTLAKPRAAFVCSGLDLDLKGAIPEAGFQPWTGRVDEIHEALASHRMHYRVNRGQHYFELEDIDRAREDWTVRYATLFFRELA